MTDASDELRDAVAQINAAWVSGRPEEIAPHFHPDAVIVSPGFDHRTVGRDECVRSYEEFASRAVVHELEMSEPEVDLFGDAAVVTCPFTVDCEMEGERWRESGRDVLVFARDEDRWLVVWRTVLPEPEEPR